MKKNILFLCLLALVLALTGCGDSKETGGLQVKGATFTVGELETLDNSENYKVAGTVNLIANGNEFYRVKVASKSIEDISWRMMFLVQNGEAVTASVSTTPEGEKNTYELYFTAPPDHTPEYFALQEWDEEKEVYFTHLYDFSTGEWLADVTTEGSGVFGDFKLLQPSL